MHRHQHHHHHHHHRVLSQLIITVMSSQWIMERKRAKKSVAVFE